jgi:hypothetical protein
VIGFHEDGRPSNSESQRKTFKQTNKIYNNQTKIETKKKETERGAYLEHDGGKRLAILDLGFDLKR